MGSALGLFVSRITLESIRHIDPHAIPRLAEVTVDSRVIGALLVASILTATVCGLVPAIAVWRTDLHHALKRSLATSAGGVRTVSVLVAVQVAVALILVVSAGLMVKTIWLLNQHPPGFLPDRVLTARFEFNGPGRFDPTRMASFAEMLLGRLKGEPWVNAATISGHGYSLTRALNVDGRAPRSEEQPAARPSILINSTSSELPQVMGLRMVRGRWFAEHEAAAVLNESVAFREFSGEDPLGRHIRVSDEGPWLTIVGIIADRKFSKLDAAPEPEVYVPYALAGDGLFGFTALVLTNGDDAPAHAASLRHLATRLDPNQVGDQLMSLEQALSQSIAPRRLNVLLLGAFAAAAPILAIVGVYGVMSHTVSRRVREIGVRMAVGAQRAQVVAMLLRQGMFVVSCGIAAGTAVGVIVTRAIQNLLYEVPATDLPTFAVAIIAMVSATLVACGIPAARAARVDPTVALRNE